MERKIVSDVTFDLAAFGEVNDYMRAWWFKLLTAGITVLFCAAQVMICAAQPEMTKWYCCMLLIIFWLTWIPKRDGGPAFRQYLEENGGVPNRNLVYITDEGIRFWNPESERRLDVAFSEVRSISRTKRFLLLKTETVPYLINHSNLAGGTAVELEQLLLERCPVERIERKHSVGFCRRIVLWTIVAGLVWSLFGIGDAFRPRPQVMTHREAAAVLEELGIDAPEEAELQELEQYGASEWSMLDVLYYAGNGEYDFDTWEWTPPDSGVYTFDVEVFDVSRMYTDFLRGVEAASRGGLEFTQITEDDSGIDFERGTGHKAVTFTYAGEVYAFRPTFMNDWFDIGFANDVARLVGKSEDGRRLYFHYDGYQMVSVFYCDAAWAREFSKATGYALSPRLE